VRRVARILLPLLVGVPLILGAAFAIAVAVTPLPVPNVPEATEILDASGAPIRRLFTENRVELQAIDMPEHLLNALVAVEDDRFYAHRGLDPIGIVRATVRNLTARRIVEGGSTLTQQLAKNLYLTRERTFTRKLREAVLTVKLESTYSKREILAMYWNVVYLGRGTYGAEVAAQTYFGKSARAVTVAEAALLAALPRAPEYYSPFGDHLDATHQRRNLILDKMAAQGYLTPQHAEAAKREPIHLAERKEPVAEAPYFIDYVVRELRTTFPDVAKDLYQGGYRIVTSLDRATQRTAEAAVRTAAPPVTGDGTAGQPEVALVALDPATGYIRAMIGGREQRVDRNRATEPQQPGSAFKPIVYAAALETRLYTVASTQLDKPAEFPGAAPGEPWRPRNAGDQYSNRPAAMRDALRRSLNVVTAQWMNILKPGPVIGLAHRMGIDGEIPANLTIGLGSAEVTPLELTRAYAPLANGGYAVKPIAVLRIMDRRGTAIAAQDTRRSRAMTPGVAFIVTDLLKDVLRPGGTAANVAGRLAGRPAAGKTGTSDDGRDAWFVGYTPDLVAGVWVGADDNSASNRQGSTAAAPIWADFTSRALHDRPQRDWAPPEDVARQEICSLSGLRANPSCPTAREWFLAGTVPTEVDPTVHWAPLLPSEPGAPWPLPGALPPPTSPPEPEPPTPPTPQQPPGLRWPFLRIPFRILKPS
jgi:1A family penicillin-binding protein